MGGPGSLPGTSRQRLRRVAERGALAAQVLPDVRRAAGDGAVGGEGSRPPAQAVVRPLPTRWRYRRTGCPFCDAQDEHRLAVVAVEGEAGLRIDYCDACSGYLKTYDGEGSESVLLADWTSLHLDVIARDRGLKRLAASLYDLDAH